MKKAQIGQTFIIIFSLLVISLIIFFATRSIGGILNDKCNADLIKFRTQIKNSITEYKEYGVVEKHMLSAPCDYFQLCFIDVDTTTLNGIVNTGSDDLDKFLKIAVTPEGVLNNVFLYDGDIVVDSGNVPNLHLDNVPYMCIYKKSNRFTFITQGQGKSTLVMNVSSIE